jgi:hypothetical protein
MKNFRWSVFVFEYTTSDVEVVVSNSTTSAPLRGLRPNRRRDPERLGENSLVLVLTPSGRSSSVRVERSTITKSAPCSPKTTCSYRRVEPSIPPM